MANPEHLKILKQGVEAWNKWRKKNPNNNPDLSKAKLRGMDLQLANLNKVDLSGANLMETDLTATDLILADLSEATLFEAKLIGVNLHGANLKEAKLMDADLTGASLFRVDLTEASLSGASLIVARLWGDVNLYDADLRGANLYGASLHGLTFTGAQLCEANFNLADLRNANLSSTNLEKASLEHTDLRYCNLVESNLTAAILTGAKLYGTARDNWIIKDVECRYVYWDEAGKQRSPKDRDLEPGEFEQLYVALPFFEYVFEHRMSPLDPLIMDRVVQAIREKHAEWDIKIDSINARGLAPSIRFTVQQEEHKKPALEEVREGYDQRIARLEDEKVRLYKLLGKAIDKAGDVKLITAGQGAVVATDGSTINIEQHIHNALQLQRAIADEPEESKSFAKMAKKTALGVIGGAIKDIAKGQVKEAAKQIVELGKDLGPIIAKTAAYAFFSNI